MKYILLAADDGAKRRGGRSYLHEKRPLASQKPFFSGDGRTRTAVQTPHQAAFYMLILPLVFVRDMPEDGLVAAYLLKLNER